MLLDLGRNDVGRVAEVGTVEVTDRSSSSATATSCTSSPTWSAASTKSHDAVDALMAGFPAGTVSGAPKVRAMEIIDELEKVEARASMPAASATSRPTARWTPASCCAPRW